MVADARRAIAEFEVSKFGHVCQRYEPVPTILEGADRVFQRSFLISTSDQIGIMFDTGCSTSVYFDKRDSIG